MTSSTPAARREPVEEVLAEGLHILICQLGVRGNPAEAIQPPSAPHDRPDDRDRMLAGLLINHLRTRNCRIYQFHQTPAKQNPTTHIAVDPTTYPPREKPAPHAADVPGPRRRHNVRIPT